MRGHCWMQLQVGGRWHYTSGEDRKGFYWPACGTPGHATRAVWPGMRCARKVALQEACEICVPLANSRMAGTSPVECGERIGARGRKRKRLAQAARVGRGRALFP